MRYRRASLAGLPPSLHGDRDHHELARLGLLPEAILDFSSNKNPYGPHPAVLEAVRMAVSAATLSYYPDRACLALREAIAAVEGIPAAYLLPTNGASELIQLAALVFVALGSRQLILAPTFGEYTRAIQLAGGVPYECRPTRPDLRLEPEMVAETIRQLQPEGIWLCNPNNPTGQQWTAEELSHLRAADPEGRAWWIIDASYCYFGAPGSPPTPSPADLDSQTILLRSLTKEHSLAGLRLGYAIAQPELIALLAQVQPPWSVNSLAQVAGVAALQPDLVHWRDETLARLRGHAAALWANLTKLGYAVLPSSTAYALVQVGDAPTFRRKLLEQGIQVRDGTSFGLPGYVRVAAQLPEENDRLVAAVADLQD